MYKSNGNAILEENNTKFCLLEFEIELHTDRAGPKNHEAFIGRPEILDIS